MADVLSLILPLFGLILLGYIAGRVQKQPAEAMGWLNTFIIYIALPALFFKLLSKTPVEKLASWDFIAANVGITFAIFVFTIVLGLIASGGRLGEATVQGLAGAYGNIGYMGPAVAILALGERAAIPVALVFCFENIMHFVMTPALMAVAGQSKGGVISLVVGVIRQIVFHPFIISTAIGVGAAVISFTPPEPIERMIDYLTQAAAPCALFAMGVTLALRPLRRISAEMQFIIPIKLILHPLAMYVGLSYVGGIDPDWLFTAVLLASLPTATNVFVIAQQYGVWIERASGTILLTTAFSVLTVSGLLYAIRTGAMPSDAFELINAFMR